MKKKFLGEGNWLSYHREGDMIILDGGATKKVQIPYSFWTKITIFDEKRKIVVVKRWGGMTVILFNRTMPSTIEPVYEILWAPLHDDILVLKVRKRNPELYVSWDVKTDAKYEKGSLQIR